MFLTTQVHSVKSSGKLSPEALIHLSSRILDYQQRIIAEAGGIIEQFVGDCVVAYWPPADLQHIIRQVDGAVQRIVREKVVIPDLEYRLAIRFSASDIAGAFFGPATAFRFQVVGRARSRTEALPGPVMGEGCVFTDPDTVELMPEEIRASYMPFGPTVYRRNHLS